MKTTIVFPVGLLLMLTFIGCGREKLEKGFALKQTEEAQLEPGVNGNESNAKLITRPSNVLMTAYPQYRLTTVYKLNHRKDKSTYIGSNRFYNTYLDRNERKTNNWHGHFLPGLEAVTGYNMLNVAHFNFETQESKHLFEKPVLIRTLYYPSFETDTLNNDTVKRNYILTSVHDEDTNNDSLVNYKDLRHFYYFDMDGEDQTLLIPRDYSVVSSEYDAANDMLLVFAQKDDNANGSRDENEDFFIFWIDLNDPKHSGQLY